jgi:hypothetical protein
MKKMNFRLIAVLSVISIVVALSSCKSKLDKSLELITPFEKYITGKLVLDSIPQQFDTVLYRFVQDFPKHNKSISYLYAASQIAEKRGNGPKAAEYAAFYIDQYPSEKKYRMELAVVAGHYYEMNTQFEKALKYYDILANEFPAEPIAKQAAVTAKMIRLGLITPEQQLEYLKQQIVK